METTNNPATNIEKNKNNNNQKYILAGFIVLIVCGGIAGIIYYSYLQPSIYIDQAVINAPTVDLSSKAGGTLKEVLVKAGDYISENTLVARVGDELVKADKAGLIITTNNELGKNFLPDEAVVSMIYPDELRVIGHITEDKGLKDIKIGQSAVFTVDVYGTKEYSGMVDEISQAANDASIVFSISDKKQEKQFDIKVKFNISQYPEIKNGMSAKILINK